MIASKLPSLFSMLTCMVAGLSLASCSTYRDTGNYSVATTTGHWSHTSISWTYHGSSGPGDERSFYFDEHPSYSVPSVKFHVWQAGLTTLTFERWDDEDLRENAFFAVSAPEGAIIEVPWRHDVRPRDVRLKIDYDGDGMFEAELPPTISAEGDDLLGRWPIVEVVVEERDDGQVVVSFEANPNAPEPAAIFYSMYPSRPELQIYSASFVVNKGSFIVYGSVDSNGIRQPTQELEILGGIANDVQLNTSINGESADVSTTVPGQRILINVDGGQRVEVDIGPTTGGVQPRNVASLLLLGPGGSVVRELADLGENGVGENRWNEVLHLPTDGVYTIVIDPHLANVISTTVALSYAQ